MFIKNIRQFREFYKTNIVQTTENNRNPHFAGDSRNAGVDEFGFFNMVNGQGEIENKLTTILNIAGDSQAIYEFMQNAVDANSKNFFLAKFGSIDNPYLIVLNDGEYFTLQSVISILATGASSKYRNPDNIGQFGVGFKLAHRLIGADNSLKELLEENKGPILFSWANNELAELASLEEIKTINPECKGFGNKAVSNCNAPWLFKIIATNFPCLNNDKVWDAKGRPSDSLFTDEDFIALRSSARQCIEQCKEAKNFKTGTLLVIPLHPAKVEHIIGKVPKGLEVAATIISRRSKKANDLITQIEAEKLIAEDLNTEIWELNEEETNGKLGNEKVKVVELMFLYGNHFETNPFKGKPQFYRYFPMSLEQHGFHFAIHSNALTLSAARTELLENDSNKFLLGKLVPLLRNRMQEYASSNIKKFCQLYTSILLSKPGEGNNENWIQGRQWLEDSLWQPLLQILKTNIPIKLGENFELAKESERILIKNSNLPIENWYQNQHVGWFFWEEKKNPLICFEANKKLKISSINLLDVISDNKNVEYINDWLSLNQENASKFFDEFNDAVFEDYNKNAVWKSFNSLKLWWFNDSVYSIETLAKEETLKYHLINYGPLNEIKDRLKKANIIISSHFLDKYIKIGRPIREIAQGLLPYLFNYEELNKLLSIQFSATLELNMEDKVAIFTSLESAVRASASNAARRIDTMKTLALFSNKLGEVKPLYQLTSMIVLPKMLKGWRINEGESNGLNLKEYLSENRESVYEFIIKPYWNDIATQQDQNPEQRKELFRFVKISYTLKPTMGALLSDTVFFTESGERPSKIFFHQLLVNLNEGDYLILSELMLRIGIYFPQQSLLNYYCDEPFLLPSTASINFSNFQRPISALEAKVLISWLLKAFPDIVKEQIYCITDNDQIIIKPRPQGVNHYISDQQDICKYIDDNHANTLLFLPKILQNLLKEILLLQGEKLIERLIYEADKQPEKSFRDLVLIILKHGNDYSKQKLLANIQSINLQVNIEKDSLNYDLLKLCFSISNAEVSKNVLGKLVCLIEKGSIILLDNIQNKGSDSLTVEYLQKGKLSFSINQLLGGDTNYINQLLTCVLEQWVHIGLGTQEQIALALGIYEQCRPMDILDQLLLSLTDGKIETGPQLAFIWVMGKMKQTPLNPRIETLAGWQPLKDNFYLENQSFIPDKKVLTEKYNTVLTVLGIKNELLNAENWTIQNEPFLDRTEWIMPGIEDISEKDRPSFWKFLFDQWVAVGEIETIRLKKDNLDLQQLLGLTPSNLIIAEEYSLFEEKVPVKLLTGYGLCSNRISEFMATLGAQGEDSAVVKTRKHFINDGGKIDTGMSLLQTVATLKWLSLNNIIVKYIEIASFYIVLAKNCNELNYFPAYTPGIEGIKIISLTDEIYCLSKEDLQKVRDHHLNLNDIASVAKAAIINLANLQDWTTYLIHKTIPLNIKWDEVDWELAKGEAQEWEFPFYKEWKNCYPNFQIMRLGGGDVPRKILVNGKTVKCFRNGKVAIYQDTNIVIVSGSDIENLLNSLDSLETFIPKARQYLRQCYIAQNEQFERYIELAKNDSGFAELLEKHAKTIELQTERAAKVEVVKNADNKYTVGWFLNLLELVRNQEKSVNIPEVTFSKCERIPTAEKTYELSENNTKIPTNIETFDEIPALITYRNSQGDYTTAHTKLIASQKYQKLWVMFPEMAIQPILEEPKKIITIKLEFTRTVDLIKELKEGYNRLGLSEDINLKETLSKSIDFIFGPPGTGKTTELANRILKLAARESTGPIVILTPTNKAADVLTKKIIELNNNMTPYWLIRAGNCTDPLLIKENVVKSGNELLIEANSNTVLITTIHRFPYFLVPINLHTTDKARLCDCPWEEVIFDEASMIPISYIMHAIQARQISNPATHFLVAGDPLQIPPVFDLLTEDLLDLAEELQQENIYSMIGLKSFDTSIQQLIPVYGNRIHNLNVQHRSIPAIGELFSKFQYKGMIKHSRGTSENKKPGTSRPLPKRFEAFGFKPITIIRYPVKSDDSIFKPKKLDSSPIHLYSALLVSELIKVFQKEAKEEKQKPWSIGVLSPYRSQADILLKMIEAHIERSVDVVITTDTVHGFQGDENNIVFVVLNPSGAGDNISCSRFLKKEFILNVAISRAEDYLIMLIPDNESKGIAGLPLINQLISILSNY